MAVEDLLAVLRREERGEHRRNVIGRYIDARTGLGSDAVLRALRGIERTAALVIEGGGVVLAVLSLHGAGAATATGEPIEQPLGALAAHHLVGDGVRVLLVRIAGPADPPASWTPPRCCTTCAASWAAMCNEGELANAT